MAARFDELDDSFAGRVKRAFTGFGIAARDALQATVDPDAALSARDLAQRYTAKVLGTPPPQRHQFANYLPYLYYDPTNNLIQTSDGAGFCIDVSPNTGSDEGMARALFDVYSAIPEGASIQWTLLGSPHVLPILKRYGELRRADDDNEEKRAEWGRAARNTNMYRQLARARIDHLKGGLDHSLAKSFPFIMRNYRLVVSILLPGTLADDPVLTKTLTDLSRRVLSICRSAEVPGRVMDADDFKSWCSTICNPHLLWQGEPVHAPYDDGRLLRDQIVFPHTLQIERAQGIVFDNPTTAADGDHHDLVEARFLSVSEYPKKWQLSQMGALIGDLISNTQQYSGPFAITMGVVVVDTQTAKASVLGNTLRANQNAENKHAQFMGRVNEKQRDWAAMQHALDNRNERQLQMFHQVSLWARPDDANDAEVRARNVWRGFSLVSDTYMQRQSLLRLLPLTLSKPFVADLNLTKRLSRKTQTNGANLVPVVTEWRGTGTPVLCTAGRRGQIQAIDLYDASRANLAAPHLALVGSTGSGKSVWMNDLITSYRSVGASVKSLDLGKSQQRICTLLGGQFVEFGKGSSVNVNPFSSLVADGADLSEDIEILTSLVCAMCSPDEALDPYRTACLMSAIQSVFKSYGREADTTAVYSLLKTGRLSASDDSDSTVDQRIKDLAVMLEPYTRNGAYAAFFTGASNIDYAQPYLVLETEDLQRKPRLLSVVMMAACYAITGLMYLDRSTRKLFVVDELKQQLAGTGGENQTIATVLDGISRRARKYGGCMITATQMGTDYIDTPVLQSVYAGSAHKAFLRQDPRSFATFATKTDMPDHQFKAITTLGMEPGRYSEVYLATPFGEGICRVCLDPKSLLLYSNDLVNNQAIDRYTAQGLAVEVAIDRVLADRGGR